MDINVLRSAATVLCFVALIGIFIWAYHPRRKSRFEADARLPFVDDGLPTRPKSAPVKSDAARQAAGEKRQ